MHIRQNVHKIVILGVTVLIQTLYAQYEKSLEKSLKLVRDKKYDGAILRTKKLLDEMVLSKPKDIVLAHKILGVAFCEKRQTIKAKHHFEILLAFSPNENVKKYCKSSACKTLFASIQQDVMKQNDRLEKQETKQENAKSNLKYNPYQHWMPFGIGQFYNHDNKKGFWFLGSQLLFLSGAATSYALFVNERNDDGSFSNVGKANAYRYAFFGSLAAFVGTYVWSIVDAKNFKKRKRSLK